MFENLRQQVRGHFSHIASDYTTVHVNCTGHFFQLFIQQLPLTFQKLSLFIEDAFPLFQFRELLFLEVNEGSDLCCLLRHRLVISLKDVSMCGGAVYRNRGRS
jgi:hypothetical protein